MMRLYVLGSGSKGNAFALASDRGTLLIEAGFGPKAFRRRASLVGLDLSTVNGIVLTHEHGDHARGGPALSRQLGAPLICTPGTFRALKHDLPTFVPLQTTRPTRCGGFSIASHPTTHDAAQPVAIAVEAEGVRVVFVMDIGRPTTGIRYLMHGATAIVVESNYDELMLRTGSYPVSVQHRIAGSQGHLSNRMSAELVTDLHHEGLQTVVLAHLSQQCNTKERARATMEESLRTRGFTGDVQVADQDTPLPVIAIGGEPDRDQGELELHSDVGVPAPSA